MGVVTLYRSMFVAVVALAGGTQAEPLPAAQDLGYGESLYHYYLGDLPQALTTLDLAESRGGVTGHEHYPQLMRAGMLLAFGMKDQAQQAFSEHLGQGEPARVQDTARLYLARLQYQAGGYKQAAANLSAINDALPAELSEEAALLAVNLRIARQSAPSLNSVGDLLEPLADNPHLALLNLGNSAARAGDPIRAQSYYQALLEADPPERRERSQEYLALRDKALTALGYTYLGQKDYASAKAAFRQIRLDTALANRALLGYGWSAASYHDFVLALKPWQALRQRSLTDPAVQESLLAVPWAYEQMGSGGAALLAYRESETLLTDNLAEIDAHLDELTSDALLAYLAAVGTTEQSAIRSFTGQREAANGNWLSLHSTSIIGSDLTYFDSLLRDDALQQQAQSLRDLLTLQSRHQNWQRKLAIYTELIEHKRARRAERAEALADSQLLQQHQVLQAKRDRLAGQLQAIDANDESLALSDASTQALRKRWQNANSALHALDGQQRLPFAAKEKMAFFKGVLQWRADQQFAAQRWQVQKNLNTIDRTLRSSAAASGRIERLLAQEQDLQGQLNRLNQARQRNNQLLEQQRGAIAERSAALTSTLRAHLQSHRARLNDYLAQTRLSVARLLDDAYRTRPQQDGPQLPDVEPQ
ncbi:hypothetical protein QWI17_02075 [Gilvimarinus sp. SDUM040013]|uniref:Tetratricopeptide repeat protein n=1 Tax=Gilvimarinus gilvus TaxID=3058038 RepID=A0ABU4RZW2_9GAMM|nr:hypothetical protein [Gilvimarinus sp. SDUM040013]MDO3384618.1 hypothetical protein [Gilvimarinus sp. SDUM040013]MDX6850204.1 hypothetical protein [Gilvimarinus sp. SDUM040013]